jgi:predicted nucleic acid-binding protein
VAITYLLDTNTFSYIASGASPAARLMFRKCWADPDSRPFVSAITEAETRYGMAWKGLSPRQCAAIEGLLDCVDVLQLQPDNTGRPELCRARKG